MPKTKTDSLSPPLAASFNLWTEPWLTLERPEGGIETLGLQYTLLRAHEFCAIYEPSPLAMVGIHRLLMAIAQAIVNPQSRGDLLKLRKQGYITSQSINAFGKDYAARFDLFSAGAPFMQSADLQLAPDTNDKLKSVAYLTPDLPAGTAVMHYHHRIEDEHVFCPACAASTLLAVPSFATSGGAGIKPSINGVPPIYVLPGGKTLFESLAASLVTPGYQPKVASQKHDDVWWVHAPKVDKSKVVREVGYLHSLTFPARRVRLHPIKVDTTCTRCGKNTEWGVGTMVFEMGESRPKDSAFWFDPFAAYRLPQGKSKTGKPTPVRPLLGRVAWREFANLFLLDAGRDEKAKHRFLRPGVLEQLVELNPSGMETLTFRCVGLRTDMKAKIFEWTESGFDVPPQLLRDEDAAWAVREALGFAEKCEGSIKDLFRKQFGGKYTKSERHRALKVHMLQNYWAALAEPFRRLTLNIAAPDQRKPTCRLWAETVENAGREAFKFAADAVGDNAEALRQSETGKKLCFIYLRRKRKEYLNE